MKNKEIQLKDSEFTANLFTYFLDTPGDSIQQKEKRPVVLICPGGGGYANDIGQRGRSTGSCLWQWGYHAATFSLQRCSTGTFPRGILQLG